MIAPEKSLDGFRVPFGQRVLMHLVHGARPFWKLLGNLESHALREQIQQVEIRKPIYISGLARSGSTVLLEIIAQFDVVATHRYRDFWTLFTPYWLGQAVERGARRDTRPVERSHGDRIKVTPDSPEAIEEVLWMAFFSQLHDFARSNVLDHRTQMSAFESFYRDHLRKLMLLRNRCRYASKGNYNITRMEYLLELFPDARFVVPIRSPREHIASLRKQHELFVRAAETYPESLAYLDRVGHFEFGCHRTPIHIGNDRQTKAVVDAWESGDEIRGWALYWASIYGFVADRLESNPRLREAVRVVRYEDLCSETVAELNALFEFCDLDDDGTIIRQYESRLTKPDYYRASFNTAELNAIAQETSVVAQRFGYVDGHAVGRPEEMEVASY